MSDALALKALAIAADQRFDGLERCYATTLQELMTVVDHTQLRRKGAPPAVLNASNPADRALAVMRQYVDHNQKEVAKPSEIPSCPISSTLDTGTKPVASTPTKWHGQTPTNPDRGVQLSLARVPSQSGDDAVVPHSNFYSGGPSRTDDGDAESMLKMPTNRPAGGKLYGHVTPRYMQFVAEERVAREKCMMLSAAAEERAERARHQLQSERNERIARMKEQKAVMTPPTNVRKRGDSNSGRGANAKARDSKDKVRNPIIDDRVHCEPAVRLHGRARTPVTQRVVRQVGVTNAARRSLTAERTSKKNATVVKSAGPTVTQLHSHSGGLRKMPGNKGAVESTKGAPLSTKHVNTTATAIHPRDPTHSKVDLGRITTAEKSTSPLVQSPAVNARGTRDYGGYYTYAASAETVVPRHIQLILSPGALSRDAASPSRPAVSLSPSPSQETMIGTLRVAEKSSPVVNTATAILNNENTIEKVAANFNTPSAVDTPDRTQQADSIARCVSVSVATSSSPSLSGDDGVTSVPSWQVAASLVPMPPAVRGL